MAQKSRIPFTLRVSFLMAVLTATVGCTSNNVTLTCDLAPVLDEYEEGARVDSVQVQRFMDTGEFESIGLGEVNGNIATFKGIIAEPVIGRVQYFLTVPGGTGISKSLVLLEPGHIVLNNEGIITGTINNDAINEALDSLKNIFDDAPAIMEMIGRFKDTHPEAATVLLLVKSFQLMPHQHWLKIWSTIDDRIRKHPLIIECFTIASMNHIREKAAEATSPGRAYTDFQGIWEGKEYRLSDYVGKGKYVLVDFWASWCAPCLKEIPNIIQVYNKYRSRGLEVVGVAVSSDKPENTAKAVEKLGINYPIIYEADGSASKAYGLQFIPQIIIVGPDGTILANGLRGEEIDQTVRELLSSVR